MKIEIKRVNGDVLFSHECENNNLKKTVVKAIEEPANLRGAYLRGANLRDADLRGAYLRGAYLRDADLRGADLSDAYLRGAYLRDADLRGADLSDANLRDADLRGADLRGADFSDAYLRGANLRDADLRGADISGVNLSQMNGFNFSQCSFSAHGECGRVLTGIEIDGEVVFFCGCFKGSEKDLRDYIENGNEKYKKSRLFALEFVLKSINM